MKKPLVLMILDGFGIAPSEGNAIAAAKHPNLDQIFAENPHTQIGASGMDVGLPDGQMGNSEVGHTNIGAGRIVYQELTRITKSAQDGDMDKNEALLKAMNNAKENGKALHFMGLLSDGGVHSHNTHLYALLEMAKRVANYYLNRLPSDNVCNWDLIFTADSDPRDSSAAPVVACGLLEISKHLPENDEYKTFYKTAAENILMNLYDNYSTQRVKSNGLLLHGVYVKDKGDGGLGDDECCIWGDYFFLEGLMRLKKPDWNPYW